MRPPLSNSRIGDISIESGRGHYQRVTTSGEPNNTGSHGEPENAAIMNWGGDGGYGDGWNDNSENNKFRGIVELE
jgi:hypothetical protein